MKILVHKIFYTNGQSKYLVRHIPLVSEWSVSEFHDSAESPEQAAIIAYSRAREGCEKDRKSGGGNKRESEVITIEFPGDYIDAQRGRVILRKKLTRRERARFWKAICRYEGH